MIVEIENSTHLLCVEMEKISRKVLPLETGSLKRFLPETVIVK